LQVEGGDPTRMPGQIVVGVGFLGAGVIMHRRRTVSGLTSASVVWLLAAIGMLAGLGAHDAALAITGVVLACVVVLGRLEARLPWLHRGAHAHKDPRTRNGRSERPGPREDDEDADPGQA
jgi:putative Mg2+ transporter-C (MgtC) family protein